MRRITRVLRTCVAASTIGILVLAQPLPASPATAAPPGSAATEARTEVVIEFDGRPASAELSAAGSTSKRLTMARGRSDELREQHTAILRRAKNQGLDVTVTDDLTTVLNGVVAEVPSSKFEAIRSMPGIRAVHHDATYHLMLDDSVPLVGAPEVWQLTAPDGGQVRGDGVVVAVLDSGVDYRHPDLGGGFGDGHKVVAGYDFVNDDADPMDDQGHGTHVAGIIAGDGGVKGVAPDARIAAYKVTNQFGQGQLSDILPAMDLAVAADNPHRADVINLSLGGPGDGTDPLSAAASQAVAAGVVVVASAGNSGPVTHSISAPAASPDVLAVGASASGIVVPRVAMSSPSRQDLRGVRRDISASGPQSPFVSQVVDIGSGQTGSYDDVDVSGKTVLISDTGDALQIATAAEERGAAAALFYIPDFSPAQPQAQALPSANGRSSDASASLTDAFTVSDEGRLARLVAMQIPGASAATLQRALADGRVDVEISGFDGTDLLADFSSRGPSDLFLAKPDLVAPGVEIRSSGPDGTHLRMSGTSMAAPHVSGAAALLRQLHPDRDARAIAAALTSTSKPLDGLNPGEQGAGRLDVQAAARAAVVPAPRALSLGLADLGQASINRTAEVGLRNTSEQAVPATLSVQPSGSTELEVGVEPRQLLLQPGSLGTATLSVAGGTPTGDGDVTGWVTVDLHSDGTIDLRMPYELAVRHLEVHVTPDPVLEATRTFVYVRSSAVASQAPQLEVTCPGLPVQRMTMQPSGTSLWRAQVNVGDPGLCTTRTTMTTDTRYGGVTMTGSVGFEVSATVNQLPSAEHWQPIGPNAAEGLMVFDADNRDRMAVFPWGSPSFFQTTDRLQTWRQMKTMPMAGGAVAGAVADPHQSGVMYAAVNGGGADPSYQGRVLRTDDAGKTWRDLSHPDTRLTEIAVSPSGGVLAVGDAAGRIRLTSDGGASWRLIPGTRSVLQDLHWIADDLYMTSTRGLEVIRSAARDNPAPPQVLFRPGTLGWAGEVAGDGGLLLVTAYPAPTLYESTDNGAHFHEAFRPGGSSFQDVKLIGDDVYAANTRGVYVGRDRGTSWQLWGDPSTTSVKSNIATWSDPDKKSEDTFYVGASGAGIYATDQPGSFRRTGVPGSDVFGLATAQDSDGEVLIAGTFRNTFRTDLVRRESVRPEDFEWESSGGEGLLGVSVPFLQADPTDPSVVYKVTRDSVMTFSVWRSDDAGGTWTRRAGIAEAPTALLVHPANPDHIYAGYVSLTGAGLAISRDGGQTWHKYDQGRVFQALAGDPTDPQRLWAGDFSGMYVSEDAGVSFRKVSDVPVTAIEVDPKNPKAVVVGGRQLSLSQDGGKTVQAAEHVDLDMWVTDIAFSPTDPNTVYAASGPFFDELGVLRNGRGVWRSSDGGKTWTSMTQGLDNTDVLSLTVSHDGKQLFAGTLGGSVYRIKITGSQR
jgi:subtilisin family serine protease/photosystem II stability/assembly factor-like uncharacterized protein